MDPIRPFYLDLDDKEVEAFLEGTRAILKSGMLILGEVDSRVRAGVRRVRRHAPRSCREQRNDSAGNPVEDATAGRPDGPGSDEHELRDRGRGACTPAAGSGSSIWIASTFAPTLAMVKRGGRGPRGRGDRRRAVGAYRRRHLAGIPRHVVAYCRDRGLFALEDCAHAHGSTLGGVKAGNLADGGAFSFFPTKVMTTCEGGMITTNSDEEDAWARSFRNQGKRGMAFGGLHHDMGNSHRITEINAHLGRIQLGKLPDMLGRRRAVYDRITAALDDAGHRLCLSRPYGRCRQLQAYGPAPGRHRWCGPESSAGRPGCDPGRPRSMRSPATSSRCLRACMTGRLCRSPRSGARATSARR